jgi:hypothetical protein
MIRLLLLGWRTSELPAWLTKDAYIREVQPRLKTITLSALASTLGTSLPYAVDIRSGRRIQHPRHWHSLAQLILGEQKIAIRRN